MHGLALTSPAEEAEGATLAALLRCCVREVAGPRGLVWPAPPYVLLRVGGELLRARTRGGAALRFEGRPERLEAGAWHPLTTDELVRLAQADLGRGRGHNEEFAGQVAASRTAMAVILRARAAAVPPADPWLASEQALVYGHPFHPSPKARGGRGWLRYAPEAHASFPLRLLGVRADALAQEGDVTALDGLGEAPAGYRLLPAHPWQLDLLRPALGGELVDLGPGPAVMPTSSVRTVYAPDAGVCLKFSLDVRITNCVRKNAWYELAGAVELTRRLTPIFHDISRKHPGTRWLPEPGYRSADLGPRLLEGLGVIVRTGPWLGGSPGVTPILAGALAAGSPAPEALGRDPLAWWTAYVSAVARPVLELYFTHGVILEPHLQNVLVDLDASGLPVAAVFRDLEGAKLVTGRHDLTGLAPQVARAVSYDAERGWARVVYCLLVNHLVEIAATVAGHGADGEDGADGEGEILPELWKAAREILLQQAGELGWPLPLSDLLAGSPLPAKANLSVRWARAADRSAGYVPIANPLA
ncbi:iron transporter [Nonomuraea glycinis]|uniref:Iron transporter n=1 Tax=Nonomuraea glycinis TaxID=2047744 RepID=A0A918A9Y1_9ACTN|nr:IucA/IucC family protein [Nonomuraea glycinis]MCA2180779.1 iron transporter [Nonomuraea glycinis]GGP11728.1 iron transporter [Nonomuraea glycinis]